MTPPLTPDPAAEAVSALREALAEAFERRFPLTRWQAEAHADGFLKGPLAPLLADIAALRTRAEEDKAWAAMTISVVEEQRDDYRQRSKDAEARAVLAENNAGIRKAEAAEHEIAMQAVVDARRAAEARAEDAEARAERIDAKLGELNAKVAECLPPAETLVAEREAATADRDRLATELAEARAALRGMLAWADDPGDPDSACSNARDQRRVEAARRALTTAKGEADVKA